MVAKSDPTLMFINSGMAPLKDFFLGNQTPPSKRIADTQKCLRVSGKHNDLEDVGMDGYHHTMFEMLGNWSFGDYFKKDALEWSWELLTEIYKIPKDRLYVSIFEGNAAEGVPFDQEAYDVWRTMLPEDRILKFGKKENFWEMGDQGPCGPCSEIHVDLRPDAERAKVDGRDLVNADDPNVIEVWNNVFMQFNRKADGSLEELPAKSVDTGMGFERLCRAVQGARSNYDTDLWKPLFDFLGKLSGHTYEDVYPGSDSPGLKADIAMRVVADHLRAVSFAIADGQMPDNGGAGYVIRRILRRAVRYYYSVLDIKEPVMYRMAPILAEEFHDVFPELKAQIDFVSKVILEEEKGFLRTLESGLKRFETIDAQNKTVGGAQAFELYDTYGFPYDLTALLAKEKGWNVDEAGFKVALQGQKDRSRKDAAKQVGDWMVLRDEANVDFVGYDQLETRKSHVSKYRAVTAKGEVQYQIVLNRTPFYPEGGGQVGDTGWMIFGGSLQGGGGQERVRVLDTKKENTLIYHIVEKLPEQIDDETVRCEVDEPKRRLTEANHSATHLLHAALRSVLGTHVQQKGSFLNEETLRFDFQHFQKLSDEELAEIERIVNQKIRENIALEEARNLPIEEAQKAGAMMLFGEKYGETVRMITFDPQYSRELCGGCHVKYTGQIGYFKITAETAIAAGVRRIEAVTAKGAEQWVSKQEASLSEVKEVLKNPKDPVKAITDLLEKKKLLEKLRDTLYQWKASRFLEALKSDVEPYEGLNLLVKKINLDEPNVVKTLSDNLESYCKDAVIVLAYETEDKAFLVIRVSDNLVKSRDIHAGKIVQTLAKDYLSGGGGGQPSFASGNGSNKAGLDKMLDAVKGLIPVLGKPAQHIPEIYVNKDVPTSAFTKDFILKFAKTPFESHYNHPAWKYFTEKSAEFQRKVILSQGRADFTQAYRDLDFDYSLQPYELVDMYCYYYLQMHYSSSLALFANLKEALQKTLLDQKDFLFIDIGCGPLTSGAALVEAHNQSGQGNTLKMHYIGFDNSEAMLEKAEQVAVLVRPLASESVFEFASEESRVLEMIDAFTKTKQHERTTVIINLCYVMAAYWFDPEENLNKFATFLEEISHRFEGQSIRIVYQNPVYEPLHRNWDRLKSKLKYFGNLKPRAGVINFRFKDIAGSWANYPTPNMSTRFEWYSNENI